MLKSIAILLLALVIAFGGVLLARYAEADDAPGGVFIAVLIILGAVGLGVFAVHRITSSRRQ
jgi:hypothetical protein